MEPITVNSLDEVKLNLFRKYIYEFVLIALCCSTIYLFREYANLDASVKTYLTQDRVTMIQVINNNTQALNLVETIIKK